MACGLHSLESISGRPQCRVTLKPGLGERKSHGDYCRQQLAFVAPVYVCVQEGMGEWGPHGSPRTCDSQPRKS